MAYIDEYMYNIDMNGIDALPQLFSGNTQHLPSGLRWESRNDLRDLFNLWMVIEGRGEYRYGDTSVTLSPGSCLLIRRWEESEITIDPDSEARVMYVLFDYGASMSQVMQSPDRLPVRHRALQDVPFMMGLLSRIHSRSSRNGKADPAIVPLLTSALLELDRYDRSVTYSGLALEHYQAMSSAHDRIRSSPESILSIRDLSQEYSYSLDHFIRIFKKYIGMTPGNALIQSRISVAKHFLEASGKSIFQIADSLRYSDAFAFSRQFKSRTGFSPSAYRKLLPGM